MLIAADRTPLEFETIAKLDAHIREGKPLTGAAKTSFIKKCKVDACATKAVSKDGKPLSGAAKKSFMKKCAKEA